MHLATTVVPLLPEPSTQPPATQRLRLLLLEQAGKKHLLLTGADRFVQLDLLCRLLGDGVRAGRASEQTHWRSTLLAQIEGKPVSAEDLPPFIIDAALIDTPRPFIDVDSDGLTAALPAESWLGWCEGARRGEISLPVAELAATFAQAELEESKFDGENSAGSFTAQRVRARLDETLSIPPLSEVGRRLIQLQANPDATSEDLARIVEYDASLAAQVVGWASSPFYGKRGGVRTVREAIIRVLGFELVLNLAIGLAMKKSLGQPQDAPHGLTPYARQSIYTATATAMLSTLMPRSQRPTYGAAYLCGLLHNYGYLLLAHLFPPHFSLICRHQELNPQTPRYWIEQHLLGVTREQVSCWLFRQWSLPQELIAAIQGQNGYVDDARYACHGQLLYLCSRLLRERNLSDAPHESVDPALYERLQLDAAEVALRMDELISDSQTLDQLAQSLGR